MLIVSTSHLRAGVLPEILDPMKEENIGLP